MVREFIHAKGHKNITATHKSTLQITKETAISRRADCVIAVAADKALSDLSAEFKNIARTDGARINLTIIANGFTDIVSGEGSSQLEYNDISDCVVRKSGFVSARTFIIHADKSAAELDRKLIENLKKPEDILIIVETIPQPNPTV